MSDPALRAALFRFVDVRPACATPADVTRHLHELLADAEDSRLARPRRRHHRPQARHPPRRRDRRHGRQADGPALHRRRRRQGLAAARSPACGRTASTPPSTCSARPRSPRPRPTATCSAARTPCARSPAAATQYPDRDVNLSVKVSALTPLLRPEAPERGIEGARPRLRHLLRVARDVGAHLHVDMESFDTREAITRLTLDLLSAARVRRRPVRRHRPAGLPRRLARVPRRADRLGARPRRASTRSRSAWSRAPTGTTRSSRPPRTAGRRRSSPTAASATATSRRSPSA